MAKACSKLAIEVKTSRIKVVIHEKPIYSIFDDERLKTFSLKFGARGFPLS